MKDNTSLSLSKKQKVSSLSIDKGDLGKLVSLLSRKADEAGEIEVRDYKMRDNQSEEEFNNIIKEARNCFKLQMVVTDNLGNNLTGPADEVMKSPDFPDKIRSIYFVCGNDLKTIHNIYPKNSFEIFLDFFKPKILDFSFLPSQETPNESNMAPRGLNATWVHGVSAEVFSFLKERESKFSVVHNHSVYDVLLWIVGFPLVFWSCYKLSIPIKSFGEITNEFIRNATYVYVSCGILFLFRLLFHYLRWVCPLVEYKSDKNSIIKHRVFLGTICLGVFGNFLYDIVKKLF